MSLHYWRNKRVARIHREICSHVLNAQIVQLRLLQPPPAIFPSWCQHAWRPQLRRHRYHHHGSTLRSSRALTTMAACQRQRKYVVTLACEILGLACQLLEHERETINLQSMVVVTTRRPTMAGTPRHIMYNVANAVGTWTTTPGKKKGWSRWTACWR